MEPILSFKPAFALPDGIFSPLDRVIHQNQDITSIVLHGTRDRYFYESFLQETIDQSFTIQFINKILPSTKYPEELISQFGLRLKEDTAYLQRNVYSTIKSNFCEIEGSHKNIWIHPEAEISRSCVLDARQGDIIIEDEVQVGPFSILRGPIYIGQGSQINRADISNSRIGKFCRIGGEITHSMIGNFTNKSHEGFLGHSIIGDWVNLGALTTTSNLKNNYGIVRLEYQAKSYNTKTQKFGSIIGDFSKTSIGTMLTTGSILDTGSLLFEGRLSKKYYSPFFWGGEKSTRYELDRFIDDIKKIMQRRNQQPTKRLLELIKTKHSIFS